MENKYFVKYEQAVTLKQLGFDEPCFGYYQGGTNKLILEQIINKQGDGNWCSAPLKSQVFDWFREKHNLRGFIGFRPNVKKFDYHIYDMSLSGTEYVKQRTMEEYNKDPLVGTYNEAEDACISKLIEIVKKTNTYR